MHKESFLSEASWSSAPDAVNVTMLITVAKPHLNINTANSHVSESYLCHSGS